MKCEVCTGTFLKMFIKMLRFLHMKSHREIQEKLRKQEE